MHKECRGILNAYSLNGGLIRMVDDRGNNVAANNIVYVMTRYGLGEFVLPRRFFDACAKYLRSEVGVWVHTTRQEGYNLADIFWLAMGYLGIGLDHHVYTRMFKGCKVYVVKDEELPSSILMRRADGGQVYEFFISNTVAVNLPTDVTHEG